MKQWQPCCQNPSTMVCCLLCTDNVNSVQYTVKSNKLSHYSNKRINKRCISQFHQALSDFNKYYGNYLFHWHPRPMLWLCTRCYVQIPKSEVKTCCCCWRNTSTTTTTFDFRTWERVLNGYERCSYSSCRDFLLLSDIQFTKTFSIATDRKFVINLRTQIGNNILQNRTVLDFQVKSELINSYNSYTVQWWLQNWPMRPAPGGGSPLHRTGNELKLFSVVVVDKICTPLTNPQ